jgi:hypothetical protein
MHRELVAASPGEIVTALIGEEYSYSPMNCRLEISLLGNSDVTKSRHVVVRPRAAVIPVNTDNGTECLQQEG